MKVENDNRPVAVEQEQRKWFLSVDIEKVVQETPNMLQVQKDALIKKLHSLTTPDTASANVPESALSKIEEILGKGQDNSTKSAYERLDDIHALIEDIEETLTEVEDTLDIDSDKIGTSRLSTRLEEVSHAVERLQYPTEIVRAVIIAITNSPTSSLTQQEKQNIQFELRKIGVELDSTEI